MATHHGNEGAVYVGANQVAEVRSFSINETAETADDSAMGDTARTHKVGMTTWDGTVSCMWDETDTNGQEALTIGASVTLNLYPEGNASTDRYATGTATVTGLGISVDMGDVITREVTVQGNGALTWGAVV